MEVFAGFLAHTDHEVGRLINAIDQIGELDNTLVFYIVGDNGASAEGGLTGSVNELKVFNGVPESREQLLASLNDLGSPKTFNHFHAAWAWAVQYSLPMDKANCFSLWRNSQSFSYCLGRSH